MKLVKLKNPWLTQNLHRQTISTALGILPTAA